MGSPERAKLIERRNIDGDALIKQDLAGLTEHPSDDKRFYTLVEIAEMEPSFEMKYYDSDK